MTSTGIGTSLILIAMGAILAFAVNFQTTGVDVNAIGLILMVVGIIGLLFSLVFLGELFGSNSTSTMGHGHAGGGGEDVVTRRTTYRNDVPDNVDEVTTERVHRH